MSIQWNKVTWYSKLIAVILFVATFYLGFYLGQKKKEVDVSNPVVPEIKQTVSTGPTVTIGTKNIKETNFTGKVATISGKNLLALKAQVYIDQKVADFKKQADVDVPAIKKQFGADSPSSQYEIDIDAKDVKGAKAESVVMQTYTFTGGAHGSTVYNVITVGADGLPVQAGKVLSLDNIIKSDQQIAFTNFVKQALKAWSPDGSGVSPVFLDQVDALDFDSFKNWSLDDKNLTIYFSQYDIGPGVLGPVAFPLSLEKIKDFLK